MGNRRLDVLENFSKVSGRGFGDKTGRTAGFLGRDGLQLVVLVHVESFRSSAQSFS